MSMMTDTDIEPVLLVPPEITKSSYKILLEYDFVGRTWHPEGRYGSRTHEVKGTGKIGLPLLKSPRNVEHILKVIKERDDCKDSSAPMDGNMVGAKYASLRKLLFTPGVELIFETPIKSNREPKLERFDATCHPEFMRKTFPVKMREFLINRMTSSKDSVSMSRMSCERSRIKAPSAFTFCELFAGIGGFGVALEELGGTCVFASEIYEPSKKIFCANLDVRSIPGECVWGDIWNVNSKDVPSHDILVAGFPCQPFSSLGNQPGLEDSKTVSGRKFGDQSNCHWNSPENTKGRGQLFTQIVRILKDCQPKAFLLENVPGLLTTPYKNGTAWQEIERSLESAGYHISKEVISSRGMTAQARKRLYIVGIREHSRNLGLTKGAVEGRKSEPFQFPFMPDLGLRAFDVLHSPEYLNTSLNGTGIPKCLVHILEQKLNSITPAALFRVSDSQLHQLRNRSRAWKPAKLAWADKSLDTIDSHYGVTVGKGNSQLVPSPAPYHPRRFTPRECARIMGFSNNFSLGEFDESRFSPRSNEEARFNGFIKEQYYMLGNAVCPPVISVLVGSILDYALIDNEDWVEKGLWTGIKLSIDAVSPDQESAVCSRLLSSLCRQ